MTGPRPAGHLAALAPYPVPKLDGEGPALASLAQNESACAPSPAAVAAAAEALGDARRYPDADWRALRAAIAEVHGLDPATILCGGGSLDLIGAVARCFLGPGDRAVTSAYGYLWFRSAALMTGAAVDLVPEPARRVDVEAMLRAVTPATRVVFVAEPGNPTGTRIGREALVALREGLPRDVLLMIDEAYGEFAAGEGVFDLPERGDTVVLRSFSKAYGLAGLRAGWCVVPAGLAGEVRKVMAPSSLSAPAEAAAVAAMRDQAWMRATVATTAERRDRFVARVRAAGVGVEESSANFALLDFGSVEAARAADGVLRAAGLVLRGMEAYGLGSCLRATVGSEDEMARAAAVIEGLAVRRSA